MKRLISVLTAIFLLVPTSVFAVSIGEDEYRTAYDVREIVDGVTHTHIATSSESVYDLQNFNVIEFDPSNANLYVDVVGGGTYANNAKTVSKTVASFASANPDKTPVAAVNGDLWMTSYAHSRVEGSGTSYGGYNDAVVKKALTVPRGFNMYNGEIITSDYMYQETPYEGQFWSFGTTADNQMVIGCPKLNITLDGRVAVDGLNRLPANNALVVYSDKGCLNNYALDDAYELLVKTDGYTIKHNSHITGTVVGIYDADTSGNPTMSEDHLILTARGTAVQKLTEYVIGDEISLEFEVSEKFGRNEEVWQRVVSCVGGHSPFVVGGVKNEMNISNNYPSTIIGIKNDGNVVFITNDGRQAGFSTGMDPQMYWDLTDDLDLNTAFILDGGGSSELVVLDEGSYKVANSPSDGSERSVVNSVILSIGTAHDTNAIKPDVPSEMLDLGTVHFAATDAHCLVTSTSALAFEGTEDGLKFTVDDYNGDAHVIFGFGLPGTRASIVGSSYDSVSLDEYNYAVITMKANMADGNALAFQNVFLSSGTKAALKSPGFINVYNDGEFHSYILPLADMEGNDFTGQLNTLRIGLIAANGTAVQNGDELTVHSIRFAHDEAEAKTLAAKGIYRSYNVDFYDYNGEYISSKRVVAGRRFMEFPSTDKYPLFTSWVFEDGDEIKETDIVNLMRDTAIYMYAESLDYKGSSSIFTDVDQNAWYTEGIDYCVYKGYVKGVTPTEFCPDDNLTRAQFVTLLANMDGVTLDRYAETDSTFSDVAEDKWFHNAVTWAATEGYANGIGGGRFAPDDNVTRAQLARFFYVYAEKKGVDVAERNDLSGFTDKASVPRWAVNEIGWAVAKGLINGIGGAVAADGNATRAQAAKMFMAFDSLF